MPIGTTKLVTAEDRLIAACALWDAMLEAMTERLGHPPMPIMLAAGLSLYAALRVDHPEVGIDEAIAAAADHMLALAHPRPPAVRERPPLSSVPQLGPLTGEVANDCRNCGEAPAMGGGAGDCCAPCARRIAGGQTFCKSCRKWYRTGRRHTCEAAS